MLLRLDHMGDGEVFQARGRIVHLLDLEPERVNFSTIVATQASVSRCSLSQERVNFMSGS